ncbi:MAG: lipoyl synthase [Proteobacteria bacterium]|nr:lipoyl synthase [Pseudomonadota bacterium]MBU1595686.1 lipoyl synthase [Pseudomonadota bacterium]
MSSPENSAPCLRIPPWLRVKLPRDKAFANTRGLLDGLALNTVCQSARCPNTWECFSNSVATFLILGRECSRNCAFCNITPGAPQPLDPDEPRRVAEGAARLGLRHVVVTSVTRDDLPDGGAEHFAETIRQVRGRLPGCAIEVLIPDFRGDAAALATVLAAGPDVLNHNVETAPRLYPAIRPQADYAQSLELLRRVALDRRGIPAKSGLMVGLGETDDEIRQTLRDLAGAGCSMITVGQYMRPSRSHPPVQRYMPPEEFEALAEFGRSLGVARMFCAPLVRSSYHAAELAGMITR